ncbi:MAG: archaellin/type IV pilin N-terminal domain-containing protein [Candidatus Bathyarchaeia archaeon]|jgi:flagellin-like protein
MKNFKRSLKGISPIFATLILIAIAVIAGVVVYMFTSGTLATMTGGGTAAQEKVTVQGVAYAGTPATKISVYAENTGTGTVTVNGMIIKDSAGNTLQLATALTNPGLDAGVLQTVGGTITALPSGTAYSVTLTTTKGGSFVSSSQVAP